MSYTTPDLRVFLEKQIPFNALPQEAIATVVQNLRPLRYRMGQTILLKDRLPQQVAILWEGQVRILGYDANTQMPMTLELAEPGAILGWVGVIRGVACETAIASTESICLTLDANLFLSLLQEYPRFAQYFQQQVALAELFDLLSQQDFLQVQGSTDLKTLTKQAQVQARLCILPPGRHQLGEGVTQPLQQPGRVWLVSGGGTIEDFRAGQVLAVKEGQRHLQVKGNFPVRLIGVREEDLNITPVPPPTTTPASETVAAEPVASPSSEQGDTAAGDAAIPYAAEPIAAAENLPSRQPPQKASQRPQYPYIRAGGG
ncbi:MAG: cyclic nucleotide-binding domain-containing protein, partial [Kamptonema sp. SIO4C4]|nr:cyclic nucleotide-binding domain-containing protein [Kamptonema sp. SIO4C4]